MAIISYDVEIHVICQLLSKFLYFVNEAKTLVFFFFGLDCQTKIPIISSTLLV